ncbi:unnamed protein product [Dimorphilus gyrociliatus]|uniref:CRAL-TRIO domain-containing protein n=1 Tax=Dimorphilus gyrociliatus TaxID=2664684 RepID=A0A7I8VS89_9ANNE|nr:unnamed protein product [Dimorphilus gyrociliatus]
MQQKMEYKCILDEKTLKKAKEELNEDPNDRLAAVDSLRKWISEQKYIKCNTSVEFLLPFLRTAKFSQLRARSILEGYHKTLVENPKWFANIDICDKSILKFLNQGCMFPLPGKDKEGRTLVFQRISAMDLKTEPSVLMRAFWALFIYLRRDEYLQVHGLKLIADCTGYTMKHFNIIPFEDRKKMQKFWQGNTPYRFKGSIMYNIGPIFDTIFSLLKPIISKKFQSRMHVISNFEEVYQQVDMKYIPNEYLPDDYTGERAGTCHEINEKFIEDISKYREFILEATDDLKYGIDLALKDKSVPEQSFRKLNVE